MHRHVYRPLLLLGLLAIFSVLGFGQGRELVSHFDYDSSAPLDIKTIGTEKRGDVSIYDITYASPKGGVVPAYLVVPKGRAPFAAVVWGHWYWQNSPMRNRREFLDEAIALAPAGVVSLLTDGPIARPGFVKDNTPLNEKQITDMDRIAFLTEQLKLKPIAPSIIAAIPDLYQPPAPGLSR